MDQFNNLDNPIQNWHAYANRNACFSCGKEIRVEIWDQHFRLCVDNKNMLNDQSETPIYDRDDE